MYLPAGFPGLCLRPYTARQTGQPQAHSPLGGGAGEKQPKPQRHDYERRRQTRPVSRPRPKRKAKIDKVVVLLTALTFFVVMAAGIFYLRLQFQSTYLNKSVVKLQSEVVEMEKKNATAEKELDDSVDLTAIYNKATKQLGMVAASENQMDTYESRKSTQVRTHGDIPAE